VTDLYGCQAQGFTEDQFTDSAGPQTQRSAPRAGLGPRQASNIHATSLDSVSRDPLRVPFAAYPRYPVACAGLIGDIAMFTVETSGPALAESVSAAGIPARWVWAGTGDIPRRGRHGDDQEEVVARVELHPGRSCGCNDLVGNPVRVSRPRMRRVVGEQVRVIAQPGADRDKGGLASSR